MLALLWKRQGGDDVGGLRSGQDRVDVFVGDLLDRRTQALDTFEGEWLGQHPAEPGVLLGVGGEHRPRPPFHGGPHEFVPMREAAFAVVDTDPRVREQLAGDVVSGDQPRGAAVPDPYPRKRLRRS